MIPTPFIQQINSYGQKFIYTHQGHECRGNFLLLMTSVNCFFPGWNDYTLGAHA